MLLLDDMDVRKISKDQGKLNRIIKYLPSTQVTLFFFFVCQLGNIGLSLDCMCTANI